MAVKDIPVLYIVRSLKVPRDKIFKAWTDPREFKKWFAPDEESSLALAEMDVRVGGKYRIGVQPPHGKDPYFIKGQYRDLKVPLWIVFTWNWEGEKTWNRDPQKTPPPESVVIVQLKERDKGTATELFFWHNGLRDERDIEDHRTGWSGCLDRLDRYIV